MAAEEIARVVADLRSGNWELSTSDEDHKRTFTGAAKYATVVDVSSIYDAYNASSETRNLYDSHPCVIPPWPTGLLCYTNPFGNVYAMLYELIDFRDLDGTWIPQWENDKGIDWENDVRWAVAMKVFLGGTNTNGRRIGTLGPVYQFQWALGHDGEPLDLHWMVTDKRFADALEDQAAEDHPMMIPQVVALDAFGFLQCRNVDIQEPKRPNHLRKRIAKSGITLNEIHVFPAGKTSRSRGVVGEPLGSVHAPVRGHFAEYGDRYGKGKLFGKLEGRFYVTPHVRGSRDVGESNQEFVLRGGGGEGGIEPR